MSSPSSPPSPSPDRFESICTDFVDTIREAVVAEREFLETVLTGVVAGGHVLIEDVPGTGKTLTARLFAEALGLSFSRIQFTPDLLPADVTGSHVFDERAREFEFQRGPIFGNVVLADEVNRAPPKTQSALLEAMEEGQVTVDGETRALPEPFFVVATANPVEQAGTFPLPEAQRDRFVLTASMGYPDRDGELELLERRANRTTPSATVERVVDGSTLSALLRHPESVTVEGRIREYIVDLARATRTDGRVEIGVSPRGVQRLFEATRARATIRGRDYAVPDDVKRLAVPVLRHRLALAPEATVRGDDGAAVVGDLLDDLEVPAVTSR
ncbi:AAA family ATPase [Halomarina halobia]|uniref:AAA family ATPase n=1 Tax=Halomarina halobia TaxID=3033386 RepID=A0ABD6A5Q3_9EURY|nr:AAA family ATPase [Halomarina sp. PSR21]